MSLWTSSRTFRFPKMWLLRAHSDCHPFGAMPIVIVWKASALLTAYPPLPFLIPPFLRASCVLSCGPQKAARKSRGPKSGAMRSDWGSDAQAKRIAGGHNPPANRSALAGNYRRRESLFSGLVHCTIEGMLGAAMLLWLWWPPLWQPSLLPQVPLPLTLNYHEIIISSSSVGLGSVCRSALEPRNAMRH